MPDFKLIKSVIKGTATFIPGVNYFLNKKKKKSRHSGSDALFSYSLWLSTLVYLDEHKLQPDYSRLAEIGNGGSLGIAFCALMTGTKNYFSFEYSENIDFREQIELLKRISLLFDKSEPIHQFEKINIKISDYSFPEQKVLSKAYRSQLLKQLKQDLQNKLVASDLIFLVNSWEVQNPLDITFAFSRAVMEHVNDPNYIYQKIFSHMTPESFMLHDIEFHSHEITKNLNGHLLLAPWLWNIIIGKRPFYLNRLRMEGHNRCIVENGFTINMVNELYANENRRFPIGGVVVARKTMPHH